MAARNSISAKKKKPVEYRLVQRFKGYRVGDDGSVWSRVKRGQHGLVIFEDRWRKLRCTPGTNGYPVVTLANGKSRRKFLVSRLVLEVFVGPCPKGHEACHFPDSDTTNNSRGNLRWGTPKENCSHKKSHGTQPIGEKVYGAAMTSKMAVHLRKEFAAGAMTCADLARKYSLTRTCVYQVIRGKGFKYAGGPIAIGSIRYRQHHSKRRVT